MPTDCRVKPWLFLRFQKIPEITCQGIPFLQKQVLADSLQNSCSKWIFGKLPGRPTDVLKKDSTVDVLPGSFQKFSEQPLKIQAAIINFFSMPMARPMSMSMLMARYWSRDFQMAQTFKLISILFVLVAKLPDSYDKRKQLYLLLSAKVSSTHLCIPIVSVDAPLYGFWVVIMSCLTSYYI